MFGCSLPTANRIKKSGKIDKAITQIGRKATAELKAACRNLSDQSEHYHRYKDLNEYLQERQRAQHKKRSHRHKI